MDYFFIALPRSIRHSMFQGQDQEHFQFGQRQQNTSELVSIIITL